MGSSQRKKRLYLTGGLLVVLILALLWHAGQYMQGSRASRKESPQAAAKLHAAQPQPVVVSKKISASLSSEAQAAGGNQPAVVRKKLPPQPPAPAQKAEPQPAPRAPTPGPAAVAEEKPQQPLPPEKMPAVAAAPPAPVGPPPAAPAPSPPASAPPAVEAMPAPSARPAPAKTISKATPSGRGAYPFSLLLSSNRTKENALTTLPDYRRRGLGAYLVHTDLGEKGKWWRTLYGYYPTLEEALEAKKTLNLFEAVVVKTPFANLVSEYPSEKEAAEAAAQLSRKGLFPYTVKGPQNATRLMAGAFPTQQEAEQQQRELEAQGIDAQTIRR